MSFGRNADVQTRQCEDGKFGAGIAAVEIFAGVGFGVAARLRLFESFAEGNATGLNAAENIVAGAVENAGDAVQAISAESRAKRGKDGNAAGDGGSKLELAAVCAGELQQVRAVARDELLVRRDHRFTRGKGAAHNVFRGVKPANQFNNDINVGVEDGVEVVRPGYVTRNPALGNPWLFLTLDVAIADVGEAEQAVTCVTLAENLGHGAAHGSEAH